VTLHDRIDADTTDAMRARDRARLDALRLLRAALTNRAVADGRPPTTRLDDATVMAVTASEVKRRREAAQAFRDGGRAEAAAQEDAEAEVYATYLPAQLDDDALREVVATTVARLGATGPRDAGPVIREVLAAIAGQADGGRVAALVRDVLAEA
jgi:uncharacterized protein YqeY